MFHYSKKWNARAPTCQALNEKIPNQRKNRLLTWKHGEKSHFLTFPACFSIPNFFSNLNSNCSNSLDLRNIQEQVKKAFCYQKLFWPFTVIPLLQRLTKVFHIGSSKWYFVTKIVLTYSLVIECFFNLFLEVSQTW